MTISDDRRWRWGVRVSALVAIATLWRATASEDLEWALWRHYAPAIATLNVVGSALVGAAAYVLRSRTHVVRRLAAVTLPISATLVTIALLEAPAVFFGFDYGRIFGTNQGTGIWPQLSTRFNLPDPELLYVHRPHMRFVGTISGNLMPFGIPPSRYPVDVEYDQHGFRNSVDLERADIVAIGDSIVEGVEVPVQKTVVADLARRLGVTAANLGQTGYGPQQELGVLARYGVPLTPRVVVWFVFGGNDLRDALLYERARQHPEDLRAAGPFSARSFARNALIGIARLTTPTRRTAAPAARRRAAVFTTAEGETQIMYFDDPEGPWTPHQLQLLTDTLQKARDLTDRGEARLLVLYVPRKFRVYRGYVRVQPGSVVEQWTSNDLPDVLGRWCADRSIDFLDSTAVLRSAVAKGKPVYLLDDVHWNANGHAVVADAIAQHLEEKGGLSAAPRQAGLSQ